MKIAVSALHPKNISVHYGIKWMAEPTNHYDKIMARVYKDRRSYKGSKLDLSLAYLMKGEFPLVTRDVLLGKAKDIKIVKAGVVVLATPQRLYSEWARDFLKSDICLVGPVKEEARMIKLFRKLKNASVEEKSHTPKYVKFISSYLDTLVTDGLVIGVLGRGSYFGKNGFPYASKHDNIDFILFSKDSSRKIRDKIIKVLKRIPRFEVVFIEHTDKVIKVGKHPAFSFILVSEDTVRNIEGKEYVNYAKYTKYILKDSARISLPHLTKKESDVMAKRFIRMLPI